MHVLTRFELAQISSNLYFGCASNQQNAIVI